MTYEEEIKNTIDFLEGLAQRGQTDSLLANIAVHLARIAMCQETMVDMAQKDLEEAIKEAAEQRGQELAAEIDESRQRRSFIGRKPEA